MSPSMRRSRNNTHASFSAKPSARRIPRALSNCLRELTFSPQGFTLTRPFGAPSPGGRGTCFRINHRPEMFKLQSTGSRPWLHSRAASRHPLPRELTIAHTCHRGIGRRNGWSDCETIAAAKEMSRFSSWSDLEVVALLSAIQGTNASEHQNWVDWVRRSFDKCIKHRTRDF